MKKRGWGIVTEKCAKCGKSIRGGHIKVSETERYHDKCYKEGKR